MSLPDGSAADGFVAFLNSLPGVVYAEWYDPAVRYDVSPDDPMYVDQYQWYLENNGWHPILGSIAEGADIDAGGRLASGIYFIRFVAGEHVETRKVILLQ